MLKAIKLVVGLCVVVLVLNGCDAITGEEVARLSVDELTINQTDLKTKSTTIDLEAGDKVNLWAEMNIEYEGDLALEFQLLVLLEGDTLNMVPLNPFERDITVGEVKTSTGGNTKWRFSGRMNFLEIENSGTYEFQTLLLSNENASLQLNKADLVFKK